MVVQRIAETGSPEAIQLLLSWLSTSSDFYSKVEVRETAPTHRGLYAVTDLSPGTSILRIPSSHVISSHLAYRTPYVAAILAAVQANQLHERLPDALNDSAALLLFLIAEFAKGHDSRYHLWFQSLPKRFNTPFSQPNEQVNFLLAGTPLLPLIDTLRAELREMYDEWFVPYAVEKYPDHYPLERCSWNTFLYVHSIVESRAFKIDNETMLVPFADMANHQPSSLPTRNAKTRGWTIVSSPAEAERVAENGIPQKGLELLAADCGVRKDDEVYISYGNLPNWQLLLHYGFSLSDNPEDSVALSLQVPEDDPPAVYVTKMLFLNMDTESDIRVDHTLTLADPLPPSLLASARVLLLNEEEASRVCVRDADFSRLVSRRNEEIVLRMLGVLLQQLRQQFEAAAMVVPNGEDVGFPNFSRIYVTLQREIIGKALSLLDRMQKELEL